MNLLVNQVIAFNNTAYRVICIYRSQAALFDLSSNVPKLQIYSLSELEDKALKGEITTQHDDYAAAAVRRPQPGSKAAERVKRNYELIKPIVTVPEYLFDAVLRRRHIREIAGGEAKIKRQIDRLLPLYWQRGQSEGALMPQYGVRAKGVKRNNAKKSGRINKSAEKNLPLNDSLRKLFDKIIKSKILVEDGLSVSKSFEYVLIEFNEHRSRYTDLPDVTPSLFQFRNYYYGTYDSKARSVLRHSAKAYAKDVRPLSGSVFDTVSCPGEIYEADSTVLDAYAADERGNYLGRAVLYSVVDVFTGMIAAVKVSLESAQYKIMTDALYDAFMPKAALCAEYGISITDDAWPASGLPQFVTSDNAELLGPSIEHFCRIFNVGMKNTASYRGDQKGTVEQSLRLLQQEIGGLVEAHPSKITLKKAGKVDLRGKAALTIDNYRSLLLRAAISVNSRLREKNCAYMPADAAAVPTIMWNYCRHSGLYQLRSVFDAKLLRISLLKKYPVSLSRDGVLVRLDNELSVSYYCEELNKQGLLERKNPKRDLRSKNFQLAVDSADLSQAYLFPDLQSSPELYYPCVLASKSQQFKNMCLLEAKDWERVNAQARADAQTASEKIRTAMLAEQLQVVKEAQQRQQLNGGEAAVKASLSQAVQNRHDAQIKDDKNNPRLPAEEQKKDVNPGYHNQEPAVQADDELSLYPSLDDDV